MDSPLSVASAFKSCSAFAEPEKQKAHLFFQSSGSLYTGPEVRRKEAISCVINGFLGVLEVCIYQARDIHNICIYQKQDVYAKFGLTGDSENTISTQIINGGGRNPVFNENVRLNVRSVDSSLKCEIWMLSRVRNYLEDQLLGFALVPLSEVLITDGKLEKEFSLSSTDLFHSPAGFVHLSLSYHGASQEVMAIPALPSSRSTDSAVKDLDVSELVACDLDKIEFPDPQVVNENQMMVSEYFGIPCTGMDSETEGKIDREVGARFVESFSKSPVRAVQILNQDSPPSSVTTNGSPSPSLPISSQSSETPKASKLPSQEHDSLLKERHAEAGDGDSETSGGATKPVVSVNTEPEQKVVQQDIVDMYMQSMQQFTESLAKMKLPMEIESEPTSSGNSSTSDQKAQGSKTNGSRVFYGSRAFF